MPEITEGSEDVSQQGRGYAGCGPAVRVFPAELAPRWPWRIRSPRGSPEEGPGPVPGGAGAARHHHGLCHWPSRPRSGSCRQGRPLTPGLHGIQPHPRAGPQSNLVNTRHQDHSPQDPPRAPCPVWAKAKYILLKPRTARGTAPRFHTEQQLSAAHTAEGELSFTKEMGDERRSW